MARPRSEERFRLWRHPDYGTYYVVYTAADGSRRQSTGTRDAGEARKFLEQFRAGAESPPKPSIPTVAKILDEYLSDRKGHVRSWQTLDYSCRPLKAELGNLEPMHLSTAVLRKYAKTRLVAGRRNGTIIREIVTLRAALKWARGESWIDETPVLPMPVSSAPPRDRWLTREEARRLLDAAKAYHIRLFILLALKTGARRGAIMELLWSRVDLENRQIDYGRGHGNKGRAVVPIDDALRAALQIAREIACTEWVMEFNGRRVRSIRRGFERACERAGLSEVTPHVLRHTAATWAVMDGVPLAEVARLLGDSEKMIEKVYGKHAPDYLRRAVGSLAF